MCSKTIDLRNFHAVLIHTYILAFPKNADVSYPETDFDTPIGPPWLNSLWPALRFDGSESVVIVAAQKRTLGGRELQLPCMSSLTSKTSTQKFFLRVLQVIIQLREDTRRANKKAKQTGRLSEWCWTN